MGPSCHESITFHQIDSQKSCEIEIRKCNNESIQGNATQRKFWFVGFGFFLVGFVLGFEIFVWCLCCFV